MLLDLCFVAHTLGLTGPVRGVGGPSPQMMAPQTGTTATAIPQTYNLPPAGGPPRQPPPHGVCVCVCVCVCASNFAHCFYILTIY